MNIDGIKPCPFCGSAVDITEDKLWDERGHGYQDCYGYFIMCHKCGCTVNYSFNDTICRDKESAIANVINTWNTRIIEDNKDFSNTLNLDESIEDVAKYVLDKDLTADERRDYSVILQYLYYKKHGISTEPKKREKLTRKILDVDKEVERLNKLIEDESVDKNAKIVYKNILDYLELHTVKEVIE